VEAFAAVSSLKQLMLMIGLAGAAIITASACIVARNFSNPITAMTGAMQQPAQDPPRAEVTSAAGETLQRAEVMKSKVEKFLVHVRAA